MLHGGDLYIEMIYRQNLASVIYPRNMQKIHFIFVAIYFAAYVFRNFEVTEKGHLGRLKEMH